MKCLSLKVFFIAFLLVPSVCHSFSVPPFEEIVSHCKEFVDSFDAPRNNIDGSLRSEELVAAYMMCSQPAIIARLSPQEKSMLESISGKAESLKHGLLPEQIEQMEHFYSYYNAKWEQGYKESYTDQEITEFDAKMRALWQEMVRALSEDDIEKVAGCFHEQSRASYQARFKNIPSEGRKRIVGELATAFIELEEISGDAAVYIRAYFLKKCDRGMEDTFLLKK
jgi:hypothetical protein